MAKGVAVAIVAVAAAGCAAMAIMMIAINDAGAIAHYSGRRVYDLVGLVTNGQAQGFAKARAAFTR